MRLFAILLFVLGLLLIYFGAVKGVGFSSIVTYLKSHYHAAKGGSGA